MLGSNVLDIARLRRRLVTAGAAALAGVEFAPHPWVRIYSELRYSLLSDVRYPGIRIGAAMAVPSVGGRGGAW